MGAVFLNDGLPYEPRETMRRPDLAGALRTTYRERTIVGLQVPASWVNAMEELGHPIEFKGAFDLYFGGVHAVALVDGAGPSSYLGVADPRRPGQAASY